VTGGATGTGNGTVTYSVAANGTDVRRPDGAVGDWGAGVAGDAGWGDGECGVVWRGVMRWVRRDGPGGQWA
jgi:hypothetical protein